MLPHRQPMFTTVNEAVNKITQISKSAHKPTFIDTFTNKPASPTGNFNSDLLSVSAESILFYFDDSGSAHLKQFIDIYNDDLNFDFIFFSVYLHT